MSSVSLKPVLIQSCPACGSILLEELDGQIVCFECGLVISPEIRQGRHGNKYGKTSDNPVEVPHARLLLRCEEEFREWQKLLGVSDQTEKNAAFILYWITKIVSDLRFPMSMIDKSIEIYKTLIGKYNFKGKRLKALSAAIVYTSCKIAGVPCSLRELAKTCGESPRKVFRNYSFIAEILGTIKTQISISKYLDWLCKMTKIDALTLNIARNILRAMEDMGAVAGKNPYGYIAAAIYTASKLIGKERTQRELAEVAGVTEATIRKRYKEIEKLWMTLTV